MPVPFGFGVSDFVAVGTLAWTVYKSCKAAPKSFDNISMEVLSLHAVLKEGEEILFILPLPPARAERLSIIKDGCEKVLVDLQSLVARYESLGTQTLLRSALKPSLSKFIEDFRQGKKEGSTASLQTVDSLSAEEKALWRTIRKDLEEIGISVAPFDANRNFIFDWFVRALETGAFEEQPGHDSDEENVQSELEQASQDARQQMEHAGSEPLGSISEDQPLAWPVSSESTPDVGSNALKRNPKTFEQILVSTRTVPERRTSVTRTAAFLIGVTRPRRRFFRAIEQRDVSKALKLLKDDSSFYLHDLGTLDRALWSASCQIGGSDPRSLIAALIARGGNVYYLRNDTRERTALWNSANGSLETVQLLIENGADVNYKGSDRLCEGNVRPGAHDFAPRASLTKNSTILRLLLSAGVDVNSQYETVDQEYVASGINSSLMTLLQEAASLGALVAVQILPEHGARIDIVTPTYGTALMLALSERQEDAVRLLLENGVDPNLEAFLPFTYERLKRNMYRTPIEAAIAGGKVSIVQLLLRHGVVPDSLTLSFSKGVAGLRSRNNEGEYMLQITLQGNAIVESPTIALQVRKDVERFPQTKKVAPMLRRWRR